MELFKIKEGAEKHLRDEGMYPFEGKLDGMICYKESDYTSYKEYPHYEVAVINSPDSPDGCYLLGISPDYLEPFTGY